MIHSRHRSLRQLVLVLLLAGAAAAASAKPPEFPPISEAERTMTGVPGYPTNIPAVVLFKKALFSTTDPDTGRYAPTFTVSVRRKILTAEGAQRYGESSSTTTGGSG